jgi:hypothetical protein
MVCKFNQKSTLSKFSPLSLTKYIYKITKIYYINYQYQYIHHKVYVFIMYLFKAAVVNIPFYIFGQT